jgi:hypothetical protein
MKASKATRGLQLHGHYMAFVADVAATQATNGYKCRRCSRAAIVPPLAALFEARSDWEGPEYQTCREAAWVAEKFETSRRREVLSFNHHAEVAERKDFLPTEMVAIKRALEPVVATPVGRPRNPASPMPLLREEEIPASCGNKSKGETTVKVASFVGVGARSLEKAEAVVKAAEAEPERFGKLVAEVGRRWRKLHHPPSKNSTRERHEGIGRFPPKEGVPERDPGRPDPRHIIHGSFL